MCSYIRTFVSLEFVTWYCSRVCKEINYSQSSFFGFPSAGCYNQDTFVAVDRMEH